MKNYIVYNEASGEIVQTGMCPDGLVAKQAANRPGHKAIEGKGNDLDHKVVAGELTLRPKSERETRRAALDIVSQPGPKGKIERILAYLKKNGLDLGPDGADL